MKYIQIVKRYNKKSLKNSFLQRYRYRPIRQIFIHIAFKQKKCYGQLRRPQHS